MHATRLSTPTALGRLLLALLLMLGALAAIAAAPRQGAPGSDGADGAPVFMITGYTTEPSPVRSDQTFSLSVTVKNTGTKHADNVTASVASGSGFVGLGAPVEIGKLEPGESRSFSLLARAPRLATGAYELPVLFAYRIGESGEQTATRSVGLSVAGSSAAAGRPQVVIESAAVLTPPTTPGAAFEARLVFRNAGERKAEGLSASLKLNEYLSAAQGGGSHALGALEPGQAVTLSVSLVLDQPSPTGRVAQTLSLAYRDSSGTPYAHDETVSLDLGPASRQNPKLIISAYTIQPEHPAPGEAFTLTVQVANVGGGPARQVLLRLGDESGLAPFIPLGASNVSYVAEIAPGAAAQLSQTLLVDGAAKGGSYALKAGLAYENELGEAAEENEVLGVLALSRPQLEFSLTRPLSGTLAAGQSFDIPVEVINVGRQRVEVSTIEILSDDLALTKNELYVGPLDPSISGSIVARATAREAGTARVRVVVHYRDELNQPRTVEHELTFPVEAAAGSLPQPAEASPAPQANGWWGALLRFFGIGG